MDIPLYINKLIEQCLENNASDIHFEPFEHHALIRFRVDGFLKVYEKISNQMLQGIISRLKFLAELKIGDKRLPQDGALAYENNSILVDLRISTIPTIYGEKMAVRILKREIEYKNMEQLGMNNVTKVNFQKILKQTTGLILITGPTSSGKTTTLYTALHYLNDIHRNIMTLEDPVEYRMAGISQIQVHSQIGLDFAKGLRAILRQDPNVIMIGEIRDRETANIAIQSAFTGHLILSTLHTFDSASAITRLLDMGIEPYLIASSLKMVLSQRLVRKTCVCKGNDSNCSICNGEGYSGRFAIFEMLPVNDAIHQLILKRASVHQIRAKMNDLRLMKLEELMLEHVKEGLTTMEEFHRVMVADYE